MNTGCASWSRNAAWPGQSAWAVGGVAGDAVGEGEVSDAGFLAVVRPAFRRADDLDAGLGECGLRGGGALLLVPAVPLVGDRVGQAVAGVGGLEQPRVRLVVVGELLDRGGVREGHGVFGDPGLDLFGQGVQGERVADGLGGAAGALGDRGRGEVERGELGVGGGFLGRCQVGPQHVLDDHPGELVDVAGQVGAYDARHGRCLGGDGGGDPAVPGDDPVAAGLVVAVLAVTVPRRGRGRRRSARGRRRCGWTRRVR